MASIGLERVRGGGAGALIPGADRLSWYCPPGLRHPPDRPRARSPLHHPLPSTSPHRRPSTGLPAAGPIRSGGRSTGSCCCRPSGMASSGCATSITDWVPKASWRVAAFSLVGIVGLLWTALGHDHDLHLQRVGRRRQPGAARGRDLGEQPDRLVTVCGRDGDLRRHHRPDRLHRPQSPAGAACRSTTATSASTPGRCTARPGSGRSSSCWSMS